MSKFSFGIDLGTTNSCIAVMQGVSKENRHPQVIPLQNKQHTLPSCVWYKRDGSIEVGVNAYEHRYLSQEVVYSSKRDIGTDKLYTLHDGALTVTPVDVASEILKKLKHDAEVMYGEGAVDEAVITVPAYFNSNKRKATREAARLAGINVKAIINEPTAAALAYTLGRDTDDHFMVYDLGGGTFDVTLMDVKQGNAEFDFFSEMEDDSRTLAQVLASAGDDHLGGDDLDRGIYETALDRLNAEVNSMDRVHDFDIRSTITEEEKEKIILFLESFKKNSTNRVASWDFEIKLGRGIKKVSMRADSALIQEALEPLYQRTLKKVKECVNDAVGVQEITKIILVGGSTKLKALQERLAEDFPKADIYCELNPDEAVALGAAVQMDVLRGDTEMTVSDVLPQSIGVDCVMTMNDVEIPGRFQKVISKDTVLPAEGSIFVTTVKDNQTTIPVAVYQGESFSTDENTYLGTIVLDNVNLHEKGEDSIKLEMRIDANGILSVAVSADGKREELVLQNILNPQVKKEETLVEKTVKSLITSVKNSKLSDEQKQEYIHRLTECYKDPSQIAALRKELKDAMAGEIKKVTEEMTSRFNLGTSILAGSDDLDGMDEEDDDE